MNFNTFPKIWYLLLFLLIFTIGLSACQRGSSDDIPEIGITLSVSPNPPAVGTTFVILTLTNTDNQPITGATIELEGNMSHAGMVPVFSQATEQTDGRYEAPLEFTMAGDWFILVKATLPDGSKLERQIDVPGVEAQ